MNPFQELVLRDVPLDGPPAVTLIAELQQEYVARYGGPDETPVDPRAFDPPDGAFLIAEIDGDLAGCAGLRRHQASIAELKRMYVRAGYRRRGLARLLLGAVEQRALALGYRQLILETGAEQPEALALYVASGYQPYENFGYYRDSGLDQSFIKDLSRAARTLPLLNT
jgi:GNAT superfamily N-acetyltransferase